ncbi:MAG: hypothetical protein CBE00_05890 [Planctomycetaceae bacterium TMED240]|nr:hypothetical protein [Rhodopirellula sp.]OUX07273.1 MAG: hypothetical protein CBE00_05890 [Planctomycetaceae bacterium TMED240]
MTRWLIVGGWDRVSNGRQFVFGKRFKIDDAVKGVVVDRGVGSSEWRQARWIRDLRSPSVPCRITWLG